MQSVSYMGNDETTEFYFNFPYFETSNVVVMVNNEPAPTYNIIGTPGGENADFPFVGGRVVFAVAPHIIDSITISRQLPLARIADYQPLARIEPTILNQDLNYLMEVIKDKQDELDDLIAKYNDIADKESTATLLAQIAAIHDEIVAIDAKITNLGDISTLRTDVTTNTNNITTNTNNIATNTGDIANLKDATNITDSGKTKIVNFGIPDYSNGTNIFHAARTTGFSAPTNGFISACQTPATSAYEITIDNHIVSSKNTTQSPYSGCFFGAIAQGSIVKTTIPENVSGVFMFFPTK